MMEAQQKKNIILDPATIFLIVGFILGVLYCIAIPYGAGFDEEAHIVRIYDISGNNLLPNRNPPTYKNTLTYSEFHELSYQRRDFQTPAFDMLSPQGLSQRFSRKEENILYGYTTNSIYSPIMFLPQAVIARIGWRTFDWPILPVVMLMRLAGLLLYVFAGWLAIRLLPFGKWMMLALALSPLALFQAATLNTDGFLNAVTFLFIALTLFVYAEAEQVKPGWVWALFGVSLLLGCGKLGAVVPLPLLLLPMLRLKSKKLVALLVVGALLALAFNVGWTSIALTGSRFDDGTSHDPSDTTSLVLAQPGQFLMTFIQSMTSSLGLYLRNWMASYGYWVGDVPSETYWFDSLLLVLSALMIEPLRGPIARNTRLFILGMFVLCAGVVVGLYFTLHYTPGVVSEMRQGRYLIPYAPLLLLPLCGLAPFVRPSWKKWLEWAAVGCLLIALSYYSVGLYATYYTDCGYRAYVGGKCTLPVYKNLEISQAPEVKITPKVPVRQGFTVLCNGLEEVQVMIGSAPKTSKGTLIFSLLDRAGKAIASQSFPADQISPKAYLALPLPAQPREKGASYEIVLEAKGVAAPDGFGVLIQPGELYSGGQFFVAGELTKADLVFHYICNRP